MQTLTCSNSGEQPIFRAAAIQFSSSWTCWRDFDFSICTLLILRFTVLFLLHRFLFFFIVSFFWNFFWDSKQFSIWSIADCRLPAAVWHCLLHFGKRLWWPLLVARFVCIRFRLKCTRHSDSP